MTEPTVSILDMRREDRFPTLTPAELDRLRRFGKPRAFAEGEALSKIGESGHGLTLIVSGAVTVTQRDELGHVRPIVTYQAGSFMGELGQLTGRPALTEALALSPVEAVIIPPERLRALLVGEAELGERIMRALILRRVALLQLPGSGPIIIGRPASGDVLRLEGFLDRNGYPYQTLDADIDPEARALIERFQIEADVLPIVLCPGGQLLRNPAEGQLARCLGMVGPINPETLYDVAIVGAGPAGLAASVYAASEGLKVLALDCRAFGGQAGASARIENYLGFPTGITGMALMARAYNQALKFGVEMAIPDQVNALAATAEGFRLTLADDETVRVRALVVAAGARYRRLPIANLDTFEGVSVHYWASPLEARLCADEEVALVGGGNSAGQAIVYLASQARKVWVLIRRDGLEATMSRYLIDRIKGLANVEVVTRSEVVGLEGDGAALQTVVWRDCRNDQQTRKAIPHLFLFIGADPNTDWLAGSGVRLDAKGFVLTGADAGAGRHPLETSLRGAFAIGDVRAVSVKRVAAAVGEGAQVVAALHAYLAPGVTPGT
ncbi:MAG TPA: FAD-dependent oxidoreductase [Caulobacteraceae bacterium]|jgi:thioredoxin reductase (NADPH)